MKKSRLVVAAVTAGALAMATNPLLAALGGSPQSTSLPITANIQASCTVSAATVAFGTYDPTANSDQNGSITIQCTKGTAATISLDDGLHSAGRQMKHLTLADELTYQLYSDNVGGTVWGSGGGGTAVAYAATTSAATILTVFGRIPAGQNNASVGDYSDTVAVTVTF